MNIGNPDHKREAIPFLVKLFTAVWRTGVVLLMIFWTLITLLGFYLTGIRGVPIQIEGTGHSLRGIPALLFEAGFWVVGMAVGAALLAGTKLARRVDKSWRHKENELIFRRNGLTRVRFDLRSRTYSLQRGFWPVVRLEKGPLDWIERITVTSQEHKQEEHTYKVWNLEMDLGGRRITLAKVRPSLGNIGADIHYELQTQAAELETVLRAGHPQRLTTRTPPGRFLHLSCNPDPDFNRDKRQMHD